MKYFQIETKTFNSLKKILNDSQINIYLELLNENPKVKGLSWEIYPIYLSILMLEEMGNKSPSQADIDAMESVISYCNKICKNYILKLSLR